MLFVSIIWLPQGFLEMPKKWQRCVPSQAKRETPRSGQFSQSAIMNPSLLMSYLHVLMLERFSLCCEKVSAIVFSHVKSSRGLPTSQIAHLFSSVFFSFSQPARNIAPARITVARTGKNLCVFMSIILMFNIDITFQPYGKLQGCVFFSAIWRRDVSGKRPLSHPENTVVVGTM